MAKLIYEWDESRPKEGESITLKLEGDELWLLKDGMGWLRLQVSESDKSGLLRALLRDFIK